MPKRTRRFRYFGKLILLTLAFGCWVVLGYIILTISPERWAEIYYAPFLGTLLIALHLTVAVIFPLKSVIILVPIGIVGILSLRLFGFREWYYPLLILAIISTLIYFFTASEEDDKVGGN